MLGGLLTKFFLGGGINAIGSQILQWQQQKLTASTAEAKLEAEQQIELLRAKRDILISEHGLGGFVAYIRPLFGLVALSYVAKAITWDKVVCEFAGWACKTDPINDPFLGWAMMAIIGGYFVDRTVKAAARMWKG